MTSPTSNTILIRQAERTIREAYKNGELTPEQIAQLRTASFGFPKTYTDHIGQVFFSQRAMCEAWGVSLETYSGRIKRGWTVEQALTGIRYHDHEGNTYKSKMDMCRTWGVSAYDYDCRLKAGATLEEALTGKAQQDKPEETKTEPIHNKGEFVVPEKRISAGGIPFKCEVINPHRFIDHYGHIFDSLEKFCSYWKISPRLFRGKLNLGYSPDEAFCYLMDKRYKSKTRKPYQDHLGYKFSGIEEICRFWNMSTAIFRKLKREGMTTEEITKRYDIIAHE